ncbi:TonB-dependent receptor [Roseateles saccharophilus]|uniref:TonB-dependent receptor n=1 Tax=Roseateles saccharophilus TaxID=304 RepID=A0A4R3VF25_ROSSA|nr:TonB-dependent receptor [Roseateles saccharophilus]MDG0835455.1 TonB-dependent receptor [Roseateles saccharophilus]TCV04017.1 TonB-dependent receptor [Roseateles saccharophilus]
MKKNFQTTAIHRGVIQLALLSAGGVAFAQTQSDADKTPSSLETVVVTGTRAAILNALKRKQNSEEVVDSISADEAGKLPDKSITEVLQRVVGVNIQRVRSTNNDPVHFSDGSDDRIIVRGLQWGSSTLNGREVFSAGWPGRDLSWSAVPSELIGGVDVYKNPSAERIEGGVAGQVDLRTHLPFDFNGTHSVVSFGSNYEQKTKKSAPALSAIYSTRWDNDSGRWGALVDLALNHSTYESQHLDLQPYFPRNDIAGHVGETLWAPGAANWGQNVGNSDRQGFFGALQWKKNDMQSTLTSFVSKGREQNTGSNIYPSFSDPNYNASPYGVRIDNPVVDGRGVIVSAHYSYPLNLPKYPDGTINWQYGGKGANNFADGGLSMGTSRAFTEHHSATSELAWNYKWAINDRWAVQNDLQWVRSYFRTVGEEVQTATFMPGMDITTNGTAPVQMGFDQKTRDFLADPGNYYWLSVMPGRLKGDANLHAWKADIKRSFDDPVLRDLTVGFRTTYRTSVREQAVFGNQKPDSSASVGWQSIAVPWQVRQTGTAGQLPNIQKDDPNNGWQSRANFAYLSDPRYKAAAPVEVYSYTPFGGNQPPSVVFPTYAGIKDPATYAKLLNGVRYQQCLDSVKWATDWNNDPKNVNNKVTVPTCDPKAADYNVDPTLYYGQNPFKISNVAERTHAVYGNLRFGFDDWKVPMEGNVGLRLVYTGRVSHGFTSFVPKYDNTTPAYVPKFGAVDDPLDVHASHTDALPSMNLKFNLNGDNKLIGRIGMAQSVYRPGFDQVQEAVTLTQTIDTVNNSINYGGKNNGNAKLKPLHSNNFDLALEWYPHAGQALTATMFYKDVKDLVYNSTYTRDYNSLAGSPQTFAITGPRNAASAKLKGIELGAETYLDHFDALKDVLPDWVKGFGVSANYTYVGSKQKFYRDSHTLYCPAYNTLTDDAIKVYGCDTNGVPLGALPVPNVYKNTANFALRYDRYDFGFRLAYNWTSRVLQNVGNNGSPSGNNGTSADPARQTACHGGVCQDAWWGLPQYQEAFGRWDGNVYYKFAGKFNVSFSATNLNNVVVRRTNLQAPGYMGSSWIFPGRSYNLSGSYEF